MKKMMTKVKAEKVLGLTGKYGYKDMTKAYRKAAMKNHPDHGGDAEKFIEVNEAKEYMEGMFKGNEEAVFTVTTEAAPRNAYAEAVAAEKARKAAAAKKEKAEPAAENRAETVNETVDAAAAEPAAATSAETETVEEAWWETAYGKEEVTGEISKEAPAWCKVVNWFAEKFAWRVVFLLAGLMLVAWTTYFAPAVTTEGVWFMELFALAAIINVPTGCLTNPLKKALHFAAVTGAKFANGK